jgi:hypothetical protein
MVASFCVSNSRLGCGVCVDGRLLPNERFTVAHPGDELTLDMPGARLMPNPRCTPACSLEAMITPAICFEGRLLPADSLGGGSDGLAQRTVIAQDQPWELTVAPGLYFVRVAGGEFVAADGWSGEAGGMFGLLVDAERERAVVDGAPFYAECMGKPQSDGGSDSRGTEIDGGVTSGGGS